MVDYICIPNRLCDFEAWPESVCPIGTETGLRLHCCIPERGSLYPFWVRILDFASLPPVHEVLARLNHLQAPLGMPARDYRRTLRGRSRRSYEV